MKNYALYILFIVVACGGYHIASVSASSVSVDLLLTTDATIDESYKSEIDSLKDKVLVINSADLVLAQPESNLGNHVADVVLAAANEALETTVDFAIMNYGGLRKDKLEAGGLTLGDAYELIPFDNEIVVLTLDYDLMQLLFQYMTHNECWPIAGASYEIENGLPENIIINDQPLSKGQTYRVAMSEYTADGGDKFNFLKLLSRERTNVLVRNAVVAHWKNLNQQGLIIEAQLDGRVVRNE